MPAESRDARKTAENLGLVALFPKRVAIDTFHVQQDLGLSTVPGAADHPSESGATAQPRIASLPRILDAVAAHLTAGGVAGELRSVCLLYLVTTSRLLARPCSIVLKGPSSSGKSYPVGKVLELFPRSAYHVQSAMSDRALVYDDEPLVHRMLVLYESAGMHGELANYLMRSLLSEGRIHYTTVETKSTKGIAARQILREGPTGLITTTTSVSLHPENETRLLSLTVSDTPAQTRAVMLAHAQPVSSIPDQSQWHEFQDWLAGGTTEVAVPFARDLAIRIPPVAVRLRRDFPTLLTLIAAHALLHRASRSRDQAGLVVATLEDYEVVRDLVADLMADAAGRAVSDIVRETVRALAALDDGGDLLSDGVTNARLAAHLGIDKSTALRRAKVAISQGFARNLETGRGRPARLIPGDPLPDDQPVLPTVQALSRGMSPTPGATPAGSGDEVYPGGAWLSRDGTGVMAGVPSVEAEG